MISRKQQPTDKSWAKRLSQAIYARDRYRTHWKRNRKILTGYYGRNNNKQIVSKVGWSAYQTMVGTIFAQTPRPVVRERNPAMAGTAQLLTQLSSAGLDQMGARYHTRLAIQDVFWAGFSIVQQKLDQDIAEGMPKGQRYSLHRVHPQSFLNDTRGVMPTQEDSLWSALEFYPTVRQLKTDKSYKINQETLDSLQRLDGPPHGEKANPGRSGWETDSPNSKDSGESVGGGDSDEFQVVRCMEVYDRVNKRLLYMAKDRDGVADEVLGEGDWPIEPVYNQTLLYPWTLLYFNENPDEFWPIPEMSMIADEVEQLSVLDRKRLQDAVQDPRKLIVLGELFEQGSLANWVNGKPGILTAKANMLGDLTKVNVNNLFGYVPPMPLKQDTAVVYNDKQNQIHQTIGAGDFASAGMRATRSATEAAAVMDALKTRTTTRTENIDAFFKGIVRMYVLFLQETATEKRVVRLTDSAGGLDQWREFDKDAIKGDFDFEIIAGSSMPKNTEAAKQNNVQLLTQLLPIVQQTGGNVRPLMEWIAPYYDMPKHVLDQAFMNHEQALVQLTELFQLAHQQGARVTGQQMMDAIAGAITSGLRPDQIAKATQAAQAQAAQQPSAPRQPGGAPGTNPANQTVQ